MSGRVLVVEPGTTVESLPYEAVAVVGRKGRIVICVEDYLDADALARAFGPRDGFRRQLDEAMAVAWPADERAS